MRSLISFISLMTMKGLARLFYRFEVGWPRETVVWSEVRLIIFLNHTSLLEGIYIGLVPISFLRKLSRHLLVPAADKTLNRPFVGLLFKLFSPGMTSITRKRDDSWHRFLDSIQDDSVIIIAAEGRMKRRNGLDLHGRKMTVRPGFIDVLEKMDSGRMGIVYSGGLHHVQVPGEGFPKVFKTLKMNIEQFDIAAYKASFTGPEGSAEWRKQILDDVQHRLETKPPVA